MGSVEAPTRLTGGCQCGAVRYVLTARPAAASICHCRMCQKAGGAPFMAFTGGVRQERFVFTRGAPAIYRSSEIAERGFCALCGTPLTYRLIGRDRISVTIGSLDRPAEVAPTEQLGVEFRAALVRSPRRASRVADRELVECDQCRGGWQPPASRPRLSTGSPDGGNQELGAAARRRRRTV